MARRRDLPGMITSGKHWKEDLSKRLYNQDGSRNVKGEAIRLKAKHPMQGQGVAMRQAQVTEVLGRYASV